MRAHVVTLAVLLGSAAHATPFAAPDVFVESVFVETPVDTDLDGRLDRIYVEITRTQGQTNLPTIFTISPYTTGGDDSVPFHGVDVARLPQDSARSEPTPDGPFKSRFGLDWTGASIKDEALERGYASVAAHSIGTGRSTGCPTVGDESETLGAKVVIDWLNRRARAYSSSGSEVVATWANGSVGMTGVSYNGTLPNMVATTGVDGLKAIVPIAAISNWYDYYRANGLVVGPGGYIGEDADVLGKFVVRTGTCAAAMQRITQTMGREHGDFSAFWQARDYVPKAASVKAAVFIIHGQADWNVRQRHAIQWWEALSDNVPRRMWLHKGGHGGSSRSDQSTQVWAWFDRYVKGEANGVENEPAVEVESPSGQWSPQASWPSEATTRKTFYLNPEHALAETPRAASVETIVDAGKTTRLETMMADPTRTTAARLAFVTPPLTGPRLLSGTARVRLSLAVLNRKAANVTVAIVEYDADGRGRVVTRGWVDPQNHADLTRGEQMEPGRFYQVDFNLEPKQYTFAQGKRIGVVVASTDYEHTIRPDAGTRISVSVGEESSIEMSLSGI